MPWWKPQSPGQAPVLLAIDWHSTRSSHSLAEERGAMRCATSLRSLNRLLGPTLPLRNGPQHQPQPPSLHFCQLPTSCRYLSAPHSSALPLFRGCILFFLPGYWWHFHIPLWPTLVCHSQIMGASIAWKNKFCLPVLPIKSSVSLGVERKSLSVYPEHILQSTQLNDSAPLIFYALGASFNIHIMVSIILCSSVPPHTHTPYNWSMARWTWLNRIKPLERNQGKKRKGPNHSLQKCNEKKHAQRTTKYKDSKHFRQTQGYMLLQGETVLEGHMAWCFVFSPSLPWGAGCWPG